MLSDEEQKVYDILENLGISYTRHEHPAVFTVQEAQLAWKNLEGARCKNLFLRNKKGNRHYLVILEAEKKADIKGLEKRLGESRLSFGSDLRLMKYLGLKKGAVSPFGLINDKEKEVRVIIDQDLKDESLIHFHPNVNTATVGLSLEDFEKFLSWCGNNVSFMSFQ
jgi:Ala-tRNA(Pro) deacylase